MINIGIESWYAPTTPVIVFEDIKHVIKPVLRHRIIPNFNAEADGLSCDDILDYLLKTME